MLVLTRKAGESLIINQDIEIKIIDVSGDKVKIGIEAPSNVKILRSELCQTVEVNRQSASSGITKEMLEFFSGLSKQ